MSKPKIITGQNFISKEYFAFREFNFTKGVGYGATPEEAKLELLNIERLKEMEPKEKNITIKITEHKIYYGVDDSEVAEYQTDQYNLKESFENFIEYFLPNFDEEDYCDCGGLT